MFQLFIMSRERRKQLVQNNKPFLRCTSHLYQSSVDSTLMNYSTDACVFLTCQFPTKHIVLRNNPCHIPTCDPQASCGVSQRKELFFRRSRAGRNTQHSASRLRHFHYLTFSNVQWDGNSQDVFKGLTMSQMMVFLRTSVKEFTQTPCYAVFRQSLG